MRYHDGARSLWNADTLIWTLAGQTPSSSPKDRMPPRRRVGGAASSAAHVNSATPEIWTSSFLYCCNGVGTIFSNGSDLAK